MGVFRLLQVRFDACIRDGFEALSTDRIVGPINIESVNKTDTERFGHVKPRFMLQIVRGRCIEPTLIPRAWCNNSRAIQPSPALSCRCSKYSITIFVCLFRWDSK